MGKKGQFFERKSVLLRFFKTNHNQP